MSIHPSAVVDASARLGEGVAVGPYAVIEADVSIGAGSTVRAHAVVKRYTTLGARNVVHEHAVLGGEPQDLGFEDIPTRLVFGDDNVVREGVTVHRGSAATGETRIGSRCFLMAYAHVAHDCVLGDGVVMANNVALAGHVHVGDRVFLGGGAVVHQFCRIGRLAMLGGNAKVVQDCLPFVITDGAPARSRGLNVVGLRRAGVDAAGLRHLKNAYRLLLRAGLPLATALDQIADIPSRLAAELAEAARNPTRRGFAHSASDS